MSRWYLHGMISLWYHGMELSRYSTLKVWYFKGIISSRSFNFKVWNCKRCSIFKL